MNIKARIKYQGFKLLKQSWVIVSIFFVIAITVFFVPNKNQISTASGATLYVGGGGGGNYTTIQEAVNASNPGETIYVYPGFYYEDVYINKTINLTGEDSITTLINGSGTTDAIYIDYADYVNITGFTIENGERGIYLDHSSYSNIYKNRVHDNFGATSGTGIKIDSSSYNNIYENEIYNNSYNNKGVGIDVFSSSNNNFINNIVHDHPEHGLHFGNNPYYNNKIIGNTVYNNSNGIWLESGIPGPNHSNNRVINNTVYNYGNYGIHMQRGDSSYITGNKVYKVTSNPIIPEAGIIIDSCTGTSVIGNDVHDNKYGIYLRANALPGSALNNRINYNTVYNNENGLRIERAINNIFLGNTVFNNSYNVYVPFRLFVQSKGNSFINCSLSNASVNVYIEDALDSNFINCSLSNASVNDFYMTDGAQTTLLNTSFDINKVSYGDQLSNLTVKWYMHVKVIDLNGKIVPGVTIEVKDINDVIIASGMTDANGYLRWLESGEYIQNDTNGDGDGNDPGEKIFLTPHNVTAVRLPGAYITYTISKVPLQGNVIVDSIQYPTPAVFNWLSGQIHTISVNSPESGGTDIQYSFDYWDDFGSQTHDITVSGVDTEITAYYYTQYKPTVTLHGLDSMHNVTAYYTKNGVSLAVSGNFNVWSDWCDLGTSLYFDVNATGSTSSERWRTYEDFGVNQWTFISSAFSDNVVYYHQFNVSIITTGLVSSYLAEIIATQAGNLLNPATYTSWNDWVDAGSTLSINETITLSVTERYP
jgi:parallel beta-helix repeat protein